MSRCRSSFAPPALVAAALLLLPALAPAATFTVTNTLDSGPGSLRAAVGQANSSPGADRIEFNIPGSGVQTILPLTDLPDLTDTVAIDGTTQPGYAGAPLVQVSGRRCSPGFHGFNLQPGAAHSAIRGVTLNGFQFYPISSTADGCAFTGNYVGVDSAGGPLAVNGNYAFAISAAYDTVGGTTPAERNVVGLVRFGVLMESCTHCLVRGNYVGLNAAGTTALPIIEMGIEVYGGSDNVIGGNTAGARNVVAGCGTAGIYLLNGAARNQVQGNYVGTNAAGTAAVPNPNYGVLLGGATDNVIGGTAPQETNVISGNGYTGLAINDASTTRNVITGNMIGVDPTGTVAIPNQGWGVWINGSPGNVIGGAGGWLRNVISGNAAAGIEILGVTATGTRIQGNYIGLNAAGTAALPNNGAGIYSEAANDTVGGTTAAARNVIAGNNGTGINILSGPAVIQGNYVGLDATGTVALANQGNGLDLDQGGGFLVGDPDGRHPGARNVIAASTGAGIMLYQVTGSLVRGNYVGTNAAGTVALGNSNVGIYVSESPGDSIGGIAPGTGNLVSGNSPSGVLLTGTFASPSPLLGNYIGTDYTGRLPLPNEIGVWALGPRNQVIGGVPGGNRIAYNNYQGVWVGQITPEFVSGNVIFGNGGLGIDKWPAGLTPNDVKDADSTQNFPVLASAAIGAGSHVNIQGTINSLPTTTIRIEFFWTKPCDASGYGQAYGYIGSTSVTTDASGNAGFNVNPVFTGASGSHVVATATSTLLGTSEFSACVAATGTPVGVDPGGRAYRFALHSPAPNPVRAEAALRFSLDRAGEAALTVFDAAGRAVARPVTGHREAGDFSVPWRPQGLASGVYFMRLELRPDGPGGAPRMLTGRMMVLR